MARASFVSEQAGNVNVDDPLFWEKVRAERASAHRRGFKPRCLTGCDKAV
jgi:hypothetical protein